MSDDLVTLEGFHAVKHALRFAPALVESVVVESLDAARALCAELAPDVEAALLDRIVVGAVQHPTGVRGVARRPLEDRAALVQRSAPLVLLDDPRHPGNAGAAIRVAAAAGASGVAVVGALDPWHAAVVRGSAGLHYALPVLSATLDAVAGPLWALDADGEPLPRVPNDVVVVVGSERTGVSRDVIDRADRVVSLPMRTSVSSLNLATALSAALYAWRLGRH